MGCLLLTGALTAHAQPVLDWQPRNDLNAVLPATIRVFEANAATIPLRGWYVRADPSASEWALRAVLSGASSGAETITSFAEDANAFVAINGGYFGGGQSFSLVAQDGQIASFNIGALNRSGTTFYPTRSAFAVLADSTLDVAWIYNVNGTQYAYPDPSPNRQGEPQPQPDATFPTGGVPWPVLTGIGGGPVLVQEGEVRITWEEEVFFGSGIGTVDTRNPRTAIGYTAEGEVLLVVIDGRQAVSRGVSLIELAHILRDLGAVEAVNLDGGGSSTLAVGGALINRPEGGTFQRSVASALLLAPTTDSSPGDALFLDTGDACCYREEGAWQESANAGFYGGTPARLSETGTGADRAVFNLPNDAAAALYEVAAWWVPAGNRAQDTPFTVYEQGTGTTLRVDQRPVGTANRWNTLGTFGLAPGDSIVVTDDATGTTSPAFVSVDALRLTPVVIQSTERTDASRPELVVYPNPARRGVTLAFRAAQAGPAKVAVFDLLGRVVYQEAAFVTPGEQQLILRIAHLATGPYWIRLQQANLVMYQRFLRVE